MVKTIDKTASAVEDFLRQIRVDEHGCWLWEGAKSKRGYGYFSCRGKSILSHRASMCLFKALRVDELALHACDIPSCVNPDHLYAGDQRQNVADMFNRGRANRSRGERQHLAKLTADAVRTIRSGGMNDKDFAARFGVTTAAIGYARRGDTWRHITGAIV